MDTERQCRENQNGLIYIYKSSPNHSSHGKAFSDYADKEDHQPLSYRSVIAGYPLPHTNDIIEGNKGYGYQEQESQQKRVETISHHNRYAKRKDLFS